MSFSVFKNFFIGLSVFLVPYYIFLTPHNLKWIDESSLSNIFIFSICTLIFLIFLSYFTHLIINKIFKKQIELIFVLFCFGYFLLFLYVSLRDIIVIKFLSHLYPKMGSAFITLTLLFIFWLIIVCLVYKFKVFKIVFVRTITIFSLINLCFYFFSNYNYIFEYLKNDRIYQDYFINKKPTIDIQKLVLTHNSKNTIPRNIYYIILDGMIELPYASELEIIDEEKIRNELITNNLKIIDDTYANYAETDTALSSLLELDYVVTENTPKYFNRKYFFPSILYQNKKPVFLPQLMKELGSEFFWVGNGMLPCIENSLNYIKCLTSSKMAAFLMISKTFFGSTPLAAFILRLPNTDNWNYAIQGQRNLVFFMENIDKNILHDGHKFFFIHQMSPHAPFKVSSECEKYDFKEKQFTSLVGYTSAYNCNLLEIFQFMEFISVHDPSAIVVFQADHGYFENRKKIFNAIKAPDQCFEKFAKPNSPINTMRFVLNCNYNFDLKNLDVKYYEGFDEKDSRFGTVTNKLN